MSLYVRWLCAVHYTCALWPPITVTTMCLIYWNINWSDPVLFRSVFITHLKYLNASADINRVGFVINDDVWCTRMVYSCECHSVRDVALRCGLNKCLLEIRCNNWHALLQSYTGFVAHTSARHDVPVYFTIPFYSASWPIRRKCSHKSPSPPSSWLFAWILLAGI